MPNHGKYKKHSLFGDGNNYVPLWESLSSGEQFDGQGAFQNCGPTGPKQRAIGKCKQNAFDIAKAKLLSETAKQSKQQERTIFGKKEPENASGSNDMFCYPKPPAMQRAGGKRKQNAFDIAKAKLLAETANHNNGSNDMFYYPKHKQNAFDIAKAKLLALNANQHKTKETTTTNGEDKIESDETKESVYASVPNDLFYCHLCKKHIWDAKTFKNHIKERTHLLMRESIEESYRLKANLIRQETKIAALQFESIEHDRLLRMGKSKTDQLEYCAMCDLYFHGHISSHRKSDGHLRLKRYLKPKCVKCNKEFPTRIDYDTYLLLFT